MTLSRRIKTSFNAFIKNINENCAGAMLRHSAIRFEFE
jgi:hypothetical protein